MINEIRVGGIKSFHEPTVVPCGPITILTGSNSCGKSTLIQSVLLQKQLAEGWDSTGHATARALLSRDPTRSGLVRLNGALVALGSFREISWRQEGRAVKLGLSILTRGGVHRELDIRLESGGSVPGDARLSAVSVHSRRIDGSGELSWSAALESGEALAEELASLWGGGEDTQGHEAETNRQPGVYALRVAAQSGLSGANLETGCTIGGLFPSDIVLDDGSVSPARSWLTSALGEQLDGDTGRVLDLLQSDSMVQALGGIHYLGPLRDGPRAIYSGHRGWSATDIGKRGAGAASILAEFGDTVIEAPGIEIGTVQTETLRDSVHRWLLHIGVVTDVSVRRGKHGAEISVSAAYSPNEPSTEFVQTDLRNVGIGVSQVLPVILLCLATSPGSTVVLEQPELHLHPAVQSRLGDFFAACARSGRQVIIETHSEHLINRFRLLVAQNRLSASDDVFLNFIERDEFGSELDRIPVLPDGSLNRWPRGFFDETQTALDALLRERLR